jgi:4-amino-4-deoxy-L-arabinose transferase-like glycosyltransferase
MRARLRPRLGLLCALLLAVAVRAPLASIPLERDEGQYAYIAWRWLDGALPYVDSFDQKPPGVYAAYAAILGSFGFTPRALHWGAQVYGLATLAALAALTGRFAGVRAGAAAAAIASVALADPAFLGSAANTETFMLLPLVAATLAALVARERDRLALAGAAGLLCGLALAMKQVAAPNALLCLAIVGWRRPWRRGGLHALVLATAAGAPIAAIAAGFAAEGAASHLYAHVIAHNLAYAERVPLADYPGNLARALSPTALSLLPVYALAASGIAAAVRRTGADDVPRGLALGLRFGWLWLAASLAGSAVGGYFRGHYLLQAVPALALLAALGLERALHALREPGRRSPVALAAVAAVLLCAVASAPWYWLPGDPIQKSLRLYGTSPFAESQGVADFVAARTAPGDAVFVWGSEPQILVLAQRRSATRYILMYPLYGPFSDAAERQREVVEEIRRERPRLVVTTSVPASFLRAPDAPDLLHDALRNLLREDYALRARTPALARPALVPTSAEDEQVLWERADGRLDHPVWGTLAIWERRDPSGGD